MNNINELDEPFDLVTRIEEVDDDDDIIELPYTVDTPTGVELVFKERFDEETKVYQPHELEALLREADVHRHPTLRSMEAVKP